MEKCLRSELRHLRPAKIWTHDKNAIVRAGNLGDVALLLAHLQGPDFQYVVPSVVKVIDTDFEPVPKKSCVKRVDMVKLQREGLTSHFENLELLGYRDAIDYMFQMQPLSA